MKSHCSDGSPDSSNNPAAQGIAGDWFAAILVGVLLSMLMWWWLLS
jgi:hypothetical protein